MPTAVEREIESPAAKPTFSFAQRMALWWIPRLVQALIMLIGCTLRFEHSWEDERDGNDPYRYPPPGAIGLLWHGSLFPAAYFNRNRGVVVMISSSFDGEWIARTLERMGFGTIRGSSTRGAVRALLKMHDQAERGSFTAFTIDGPKGPRHIAKPGPVLLARNTQQPICCFYCASGSAWQLNSWDRLQIPKPFTQVHVRWSRRIEVPADAGAEQMRALHEEVQATLERGRLEAERRVAAGR